MLKKTRKSPAVDATEEETVGDAKDDDREGESLEKMDDENDREEQTGGDKLLPKANELPNVVPEPNENAKSDAEFPDNDIELGLQSSAMALPFSVESVNLLATQAGTGATQHTQDTRAEHPLELSMPSSMESGNLLVPTQHTQDSTELSLPSNVESENLLFPTQSTPDNRAGYAQTLGFSEPSVLLGTGGSGVDMGVTFSSESSIKSSQETISEEDLEVKQKAEMIKSLLQNNDMSSSSNSQNGL